MEKIKFTADSTCDLPKDLLQKYDIELVPLTIILGDEEHKDGVDVTPEDIFKYVEKTQILPKTAAINEVAYAECFEKHLNNGASVIHFNISSGASLCYNNAVVACNNLKNAYAIDTKALSSGSGLLILYACDLREQGKTAKEIVEACEKIKSNILTSFVVDRLDYLHKGGRVSGMRLFGANLLKIHPMIKMNDGVLGQGGKNYRGKMKAVFEKYLEDLKMQYPDYINTRCFITHSSCEPEIVEHIKSILEREFNFKQIIISVAGSTITSHCGKGTLGVLFMNDTPIK